MSALVEMREAAGKLATTRTEIKALFEKRGPEDKLDWTKEDGERYLALEDKAVDEQKDLKKWEGMQLAAEQNEAGLVDLQKPLGHNPYGGPDPRKGIAGKSVGQLFLESPAFKNYKANRYNGDCQFMLPEITLEDMKNGGIIGAEFKTTMTTASGFPPFVQRTGDIVPFAFRQPVIADLMPEHPTTQDAVKYMEETTHTANAAATAENVNLPESAIIYTEKTVNIQDVGTSLPVSERMMDDASYIMSYINSSLGLEVARAEETELLTGAAADPHLYGFLSAQAITDGMQTQPRGTDNVITQFIKAMTLVQSVGFAQPSAGVFHPTNWQNVMILQDTTGRYIFGDPSQSGPRTLWGLPIIATVAMTLNSALVGDFRVYSYIARRRGVIMEMGWVNDQFLKRVRTIRAYGRLALVIRRKSAFCTMTSVS
jgi:HK97 family phage major capsid protein